MLFFPYINDRTGTKGTLLFVFKLTLKDSPAHPSPNCNIRPGVYKVNWLNSVVTGTIDNDRRINLIRVFLSCSSERKTFPIFLPPLLRNSFLPYLSEL